MNKKKLIYIGSGLLAVVLIVVALYFVFRKAQVNSNNPEFGKYISAYTSGVVSKSTSIKVRILSSVADKIENKNELPKQLFDFQPSVKGTYFWADNNTIEFKPEENLKSSEKYLIEFHLNKLINDVPSDLKNFVFEIQTIKQNFEVSIDEQKTVDKKTLQWQKAIGTLKTADIEVLEKIQKTLEATQNGNKLKISWRAEADLKTYTFEIDSIKRDKQESTVLVKWNGSEINVDKKGELSLKVPAIDQFKFMSARVIQQPDQYLQIQFSDPLNESQNINGLVNIKNSSNPRYMVVDNVIRIYPSNRLTGTYQVSIEQGIENILGFKLNKSEKLSFSFEEIKPAVRMVNKGVILPSSEKGMIFPFEAVNLKAVDVRVVKIFENNVIQFLQVNELEGENELRRVGRPIVNKMVNLDKSDIVDFGKWNRFYLDLNDLIKSEPGAIYRITLSFKQKYSLYSCGDSISAENDLKTTTENWADAEQETTSWDNVSNYYYDYYYDDNYWQNRDNPCSKSYYSSSRNVSQNIVASNIGLIAKKGNDGTIKVFVTDIRTTKPMSGIKIEIYNYQNQLLTVQSSDGDGICNFDKLENPYFVVAKQETQRGYLKINDGASLSMSKFDVAGTAVTKGMKGFIYGERGVWRPGDSLFLTFILKEEPMMALPANHPVIFELKNPNQQIVTRLVQEKNPTGFYTFKFRTAEEAPTGNWEAKVTVGGAIFTKPLKIETIKPNRLKIALDFGKKMVIANTTLKGNLMVKWLHGAVAKDLDAKVQMILSPAKTTFPKYTDYVFEDPTKRFYGEPITIFDGQVDGNGVANIETQIGTEAQAAGKMNATFVSKVFEKGGDFSTDQFSIPYYPYESFVGLKLPKGDKIRGMLLTDTSHLVEIVVLDPNGNPVNASHKIELTFYKMNWKWWWDQTGDNANYESQSSLVQLDKITVQSVGGVASWKIKVNYPDWGRYMVRANDLTSGHSTAKVVYIDWPGWAGRSQKEMGEGATMLAFTANKDTFNIDEEVTLNIPTGKDSRALISIENGSKVLETHWLESKEGTTVYKFKTTKAMTPNVYINVTLLQPHAQTANDLPIRLYGIVPIYVINKETHLQPEIKMPDVLEAEKPFTVTVSEKNNKEMYYTLAVVDEGLLDLTRFKTPNPWDEFYAREALGVKIWDIYDWVIGAFGGELQRLLAIGGDMDAENNAKKKKANRFKPVVQFFGPFYLKKGSKTHTITLPQYIGSVRTMVIAGNQNAYGCTEKATPVKKPLMLLATMPRVVGPSETLKLPVSVFVMDKSLRNVTVQVKTNDLLKVEGNSQKTIVFKEEGEEFVDFDVKVNSALGIGKVTVTASSGNQKTSYDIELDVRNPNPKIVNVTSKVLSAGETWNADILPVGILGTNKGTLEISAIPPINLEKRLQYLITFPHGCVEQTTSAAFPQLYVAKLVDLDNNRKAEIERNVKAAILKLQSFQLFNGGLGYWPGESDVNEWGTTYAGHFLLEAEKKGYTIPSNLLKNWKKYQSTKAKSWTDDGNTSQLIQAYRLYTLALANTPDESSMNRLKEKSKLSDLAKWRLAAAYFLAGKKDVANKLITGLNTDVSQYNEYLFSYGSETRDAAMVLEVLTLLGKQKQAFDVVKTVSEQLGSEAWYSTQTTAYSLIAISKYMENNKVGSQLKCTYKFAGKDSNINGNTSISLIDLPITTTSKYPFEMKNTSSGVLYARLILSGNPQVGESSDAENNLKLEITYKSLEGAVINVEKLEQGTDFMAEVRVTNPGNKGYYKDLALTQIFPSGWEIINTRMLETGKLGNVSTPRYQDIRDDRVLTYFDAERSTTKTFRVLLNASYSGRYYLPTVLVEAMYDGTINARKHGMWVEVVRGE